MNPTNVLTKHQSGSRRRRRVVAALAFLLVLAPIGAWTTSSASAATGITYCFKQSGGAPVGQADAYLEAWIDGAWRSAGRLPQKTDINGCGSFSNSTLQHYYLRVRAVYRLNGGYTSGSTLFFNGGPVTWLRLEGVTPMYSVPGRGTVHLGTGVAYCHSGTVACMFP